MRWTREHFPDGLLGRPACRVPTLDRIARLVGTAGRRADAAARTAAFWTAVVLPAVHAPLVFTGVDTPAQVRLVVGLLLTNVLALWVGHRHDVGAGP